MESPSGIRDVEQLENLLSEPTAAAIDAVRRTPGDIVVLGAGGKMGPSLARMARRARDETGAPGRVIGVSRFASPLLRQQLERHGVETIACDLLDPEALDDLPDCPNVIFMAGRKFGSSDDEPYTWAMNAHVPAMVCRRYATSRIVAFSTGNVYGLTPHGRGGSREDDVPAPVGEYAMSCLGRERLIQYFSRDQGTLAAILRLNYAVEMRYGVLVDLAQRVAERRPVDVTMGYFNSIWQGDANAMAIAALAHASSPPLVVNIAGPEELSVRSVCERIAVLMDVEPAITGDEAGDALLSNGARGWALFGTPRIGADTLTAWTADWVKRGGSSLGKPTHFESRSGRF